MRLIETACFHRSFLPLHLVVFSIYGISVTQKFKLLIANLTTYNLGFYNLISRGSNQERILANQNFVFCDEIVTPVVEGRAVTTAHLAFSKAVDVFPQHPCIQH